MVARSVHCCKRAFSSCGHWGLLSRCDDCASHCRGFSCCGGGLQGVGASAIAVCVLGSWGSWVLEHRLSSHSPWALLLLGIVGSSRTRDRTCVCCIGGQIPHHCVLREVPTGWFLTNYSQSYSLGLLENWKGYGADRIVTSILCKTSVTHSEHFVEYFCYAQAVAKQAIVPAVWELIKYRRQVLHKNYIVIKYMITQGTNLSEMF